MTLTNKLLLLVISLITLNIIGSYYFQSRQTRQYLEQSQLEWVNTLTRSLSEGVAKDTINRNKIHVRELLQSLVKDQAIEFAYVTDMDGELFAHSFDSGFPRFLYERLSQYSEIINSSQVNTKFKTKQGEIIAIDAPLIEGLTARIHVGINQTEVNNLINKINQDLFWFISLLGVMLAIVTLIIGKRISLPLTTFTQQLLKFSNFKNLKFPKIQTSDPEVRNLIKVFENVISKQQEAEEEVRKSQQRLLLHRQLSPIGIIEWTTDFKFVDFIVSAENIFGFKKEEVIGHHITENILPDNARDQVDKIWENLIANTGGEHSINENITKDGKVITCEWNNTPLVDDNGKIVGVASFVEDITLQKSQEDLIRRTQKMDALGKLTGGIAHDYNNMLGVILGYCELLQISLHEHPKLLDYINEIQHAGERGAKLTQRLLGFSRQKASEEINVELNNLLKDNQDMLEKTLTVRIKLIFNLAEDIWPIFVNVNDLEDMILNMSINAMHAMSESGDLTFSTRNEYLPLFDAQLLDVEEGDYVVLTVTDTGCGMDAETASHIFEPFYSTKGARGTGLGLSQVYGFVSRSGGAIRTYSEIDHGTRFTVYFPRHDNIQINNNSDVKKTEDLNTKGTERLLVVDDEESLVQITKNILELQGYSVLLANSGEQALEILLSNEVDAVITDIIMPRMDGYELAKIITQLYPKIKIQLMSGFNDNRDKSKVSNEMHQKLLHKPVNSKVLVKQIRELLDS